MTTALAIDSFSDAEKSLFAEIEDALAFVKHDGSRLQYICDFLHPLPYNSNDDWFDIERQAKWVILLAIVSKQSKRFRHYVLSEFLKETNIEVQWWFAFMDFMVSKNDEIVFRYFQIFITRFFHKDEYVAARVVVLEDNYVHPQLSRDQMQKLAELASYRRYFLQLAKEFEKIMPLE